MEPEPDDIVLVAVMNNPRDMDIARHDHWYRIPVKHAPPQGVGAPFLAFYQTRAFGPERWAVNYYAPVTRWEVVKRLELFPEEITHPRAGQDYYKVHLADLIRLPRPIVSLRLRRIAFIVTRWALLQRAEEINDLFHGNQLEERLWRTLKRAGIPAERRFEVREQRQTYLLDLAIFCNQGKLGVICQGEPSPAEPGRWVQECALVGRGWMVLRLSPEDVEHNLSGCVEVVQRAVRRLGGVAEVGHVQ